MKKDLNSIDKNHVWHPYTDIDKFEESGFPIVERASGSCFYDIDGKRYIDGIASWWCVNLGHSHPKLVKALTDEAQKLQHVILGGLSHQSIILLAEELSQVTPAGLEHFFFAGDGASAIEAALRISLQYWKNSHKGGREKFICLQDGYHGDTLGAVSVGYVEKFHRELRGVINENFRAESPHCACCQYGKRPENCSTECFQSMKELIEKHHDEVAAVIVEPLCQGAGGIRLYPEEYLKKLRKECDNYNLLFIADEIAVGFGRMGTMFSVEKANILPDIMVFGKGLTGGYLPMSGVAVSSRVYNSFREGHTFFYGHTFCGNPIAARLALEALKVYREEEIVEKAARLSLTLEKEMSHLAQKYDIGYSATKGAISMIEISDEAGGSETARRVGEASVEKGLFVRPLGASLYLWPPLNIEENEVSEAFSILNEAVGESL